MRFLRPSRVILSLLCVVVLSAVTAYADNITVTGSTQGNFDGGTTATNVSLMDSSSSVLDFQGTGFSTGVTTGNPPVAVNVGAFDLKALHTYDFDGHTFNLIVTFTAPPGVSGTPQTFQALLSGDVHWLVGSESIVVNFNNTPQVFAYDGGTLTFTVLDPTINEQQGFVNITANISATSTRGATPTPEPVSMLLLGTGLAGVAAKLRKRRTLKQ